MDGTPPPHFQRQVLYYLNHTIQITGSAEEDHMTSEHNSSIRTPQTIISGAQEAGLYRKNQ
jgi:hypothetical protein